jgi:predicted nuclease of predicted toxin-antitoxin system
MKLKLDENIPAPVAKVLTALGHDVDTVLSENLRGRPDHEVWNAAQRGERFLITQDLDFSDVRGFRPGTHGGPLLLRLRDPGLRALSRRIKAIFRSEDVEAWRRCFVVVSERKIRVRVRRPQGKETDHA